MELKAEDYENIWLRLKEKFWKWIAFWFTFLAIVIGFGAFNLANNLLESYVREYVKTAEFKEQVGKAILNNVPELKQALDQAKNDVSKLLENIEALKNAPFAISENMLTIVGDKGNIIKVEFGNAVTGKSIKFKQDFSQPPTVLISPMATIHTNQIKQFAVEDVTPKKFSVRTGTATAGVIMFQFNWMAIGK